MICTYPFIHCVVVELYYDSCTERLLGSLVGGEVVLCSGSNITYVLLHSDTFAEGITGTVALELHDLVIYGTRQLLGT